MSAQESAWQEGMDAAEALAPETGLFARLDPADFGGSLLSRARPRRRGARPRSPRAWLQFGTALAGIWPVAAARWLGSDVAPPVPVDAQGPAVRRPGVGGQPGLLRAAAGVPGRPAAQRGPAGRRARRPDGRPEGAAGRRTSCFDALAPTNFLPTNPAALKRAFETGGASLLAGARNFLDDLAHNERAPAPGGHQPFELGRNLAATPGRWCSATT